MYILFGLLVSGVLKVFLNPSIVIRHLGRGRFVSVFKAAFLGIPLPLCSCGVLPAALSLKRHGASNGATTAFMISTPESGVDSIATTYALLDPIMTVARPLSAFITATTAGVAENFISYREPAPPNAQAPLNGPDAPAAPCSAPQGHGLSFWHKTSAGLRYAFHEFWSDLAGWFLFGILLAGAITVVIPDDVFAHFFEPGLPAMFLMLLVGMPLYICATASTPIAAALILKGVSPGAALVFLLAGPATNIATLTVLVGILGKRAAAIYLLAIGICSVVFGLLLDRVYGLLDVSAVAMIGHESDVLPVWTKIVAAVFILLISIKPVTTAIGSRIRRHRSAETRSSRPAVPYRDT